jgi:hypothetical protein
MLAVTLVDPYGALAGSWLTLHSQDETVEVGALSSILRSVGLKLRDIASQPDSVLVLRDGRLFEKEHAATYLDLPLPAVLIEYRKSNNPPLLAGASFKPAIPPIAGQVDETSTVFASNGQALRSNGLATVHRLTWRAAWNPLLLSGGDIARLVRSLSFAPTLGMHPSSLPAPLYWANGIAGASDYDLRFRGSGFVQVST